MKKKLIGIILVATLVAIVFAGCLDGDGDRKEYHKNASEYILSIDEIGDGWVWDEISWANINYCTPDGTESHVYFPIMKENSDNGTDSIDIWFFMFDNTDSCIDWYESGIISFNEADLSATEWDLGDSSYYHVGEDSFSVEVRISNICYEISGDSPDLIKGKEIGELQLDKIIEVGY